MSNYASYKSLGVDKNAPSEDSMVDVLEITSKEQRDNLLNNFPVVIIDNFTTWCGPCKTVAPQFAQLAKTYGDKCGFAKEDVEKEYVGCPDNITGVPCFHFYIKGKYDKKLTVTGGSIDPVRKTLERILGVN